MIGKERTKEFGGVPMTCQIHRSILISFVAIFVCTGIAWSQQAKSGGSLKVAFESDVPGMDPHTSLGVQAQVLIPILFNTLVTIDENLDVVPDLASSWEVKDGGKTYLFHLHKGVKFHDGTDCDAAAVKWNFDRLLNPEEKVLTASFFTMVESVERVDAHTLKITLQYPTETFLRALANYRKGFPVISPTAYKTWGKQDLPAHPVGTGPFKLAKWEQNSVILMERNAHYFKPGLPYLDRIEFRIMKDGVTRATALRAGEVDFVNLVPIEHVERLTRDPKVRVLRGPETATIFLVANHGRKPFDDVRVRQATIGYGIDRRVIAKSALLGLVPPLLSFVPPGTLGHKDFLEMYPYNPEKAKALLKEAGFDEGNPLKYTLMTHGANPVLPTIATIIKTQLANSGVEVNVEVLDRPVFLKRIREHDLDQTLTIGSHFVDPYARAYLMETTGGSLNIPNHSDTHVDVLIDKLRRSTDREEFLEVGYELQTYDAQRLIYPSVAADPYVQAARDYVKGYVFMRGLKVSFETTWLDKP
jgi:ABC-type transport system substrate-binding protein